jgi:hypothetical protein
MKKKKICLKKFQKFSLKGSLREGQSKIAQDAAYSPASLVEDLLEHF